MFRKIASICFADIRFHMLIYVRMFLGIFSVWFQLSSCDDDVVVDDDDDDVDVIDR